MSDNYYNKMLANNNFVIFTTGTYTLCLSIALIKQLEQTTQNQASVSVVHYEHHNSIIMECEKWICELFGYNHLGDIGSLHLKANELLGKGTIKRLTKSLSFKKAWHNWGHNNLISILKKENQNIIVPIRPHLSDILLANLFPNGNFYYIPDGYLMGFPKILNLPLLWHLTGLKNPYKLNAKKTVYTPTGLEKRMSEFSTKQVIIEDGISLVAKKIISHIDFKKWYEKVYHVLNKKGCTCVLLQCFSLFKWLDPFEELSLYVQIIEKELELSDNNILIKHHPRENRAKLAILKQLLADIDKNRIFFMDFDHLSALPIEFLVEPFNIDTLIGISSTALLTPFSNRNIDIRIYIADWLPLKIKKEILTLAEMAHVKPISL
jgi:hypothetical protein